MQCRAAVIGKTDKTFLPLLYNIPLFESKVWNTLEQQQPKKKFDIDFDFIPYRCIKGLLHHNNRKESEVLYLQNKKEAAAAQR